ncbi:MAG: hypothetical protein DRI94_02740 [Bacteroidetes bacterium]|nr:MAG: hypothetical protein DRI94_02740 [Bacteroidota bacterium]
MRKSLKSLLLIIITSLSSYFGYADIVDPAVIVSHIDIHKDNVISEIENRKSEKIYLKAGNEKFGLNHILKKHSRNFFPDYRQKGNLFPELTNGKQIIKGIENVYRNGHDNPKAYGNKKVLQHTIHLNGKNDTYRLVINEDNEVITFFRLRKS